MEGGIEGGRDRGREGSREGRWERSGQWCQPMQNIDEPGPGSRVYRLYEMCLAFLVL